MRIRSSLIAAVVVLGSVGVFAEEEESSQSSYGKTTTTRYTNYVGVAAGYTTGYGLSFRRWVNNSWAFQINFAPYYHETKYPESDRDEYQYDYYSYGPDSGYDHNGSGSLGLTFLKNFAELRYLRVVGYAGSNLHATYRKYNYFTNEWDYSRQEPSRRRVHHQGREVREKVSVGGGIGAEFYVWRFAFHAMAGLFGAYEVETEAKEAGPSVEGGVHFRF